MKQFIALVLVSLIAIPSVTFGPSSHIVRASGLRYKSVPLESMGIVQADSSYATILTPAAPGHYRDTAINSGVQLNGGCGGSNFSPKAEFHLRDTYDELVGTLYNEDANTSASTRVIVYDTSDPNNKRALFGQDVPGLGQVKLHLRVRGVNYLTIATPNTGGCLANIDVVAQLTIGMLPPTQVVPRYPTANAGEPANSTVLFGWQPFPRATNYAIHIWLIGLSGSAALKSTTPFSFSDSIYHKT